MAHAAVPLVLAAVTTALGLLSLCYSELNPIRLFGIFSAIGVVVGSLAQFLLLPAALAVWTPRPRPQRDRVQGGKTDSAPRLALFPRLGERMAAYPNLVAAVACPDADHCRGLPQIRTSIKMIRLFSSRAPVIPMMRWLEQNLGATIPLEVLLRFSPASETTMLERIRLVAEIHTQLRRLPQASGSLSAATFAPTEVKRFRRRGHECGVAGHTQTEYCVTILAHPAGSPRRRRRNLADQPPHSRHR